MSPRRAPGTASAALTIAGNDLRRALRDRTALLTGIVAPLLLAVLIGAALGNLTFTARVGLVDADGSALSKGIVEGLLASMPPDAPLSLARVDDETSGRDRMRDGGIEALIVVPPGFGDSVLGAGTPEALTVVTAPRNRFAGDLARSLADGIAGRIGTARLATATALAVAPPGSTPDVPALVAATTRLEPTIGVSPEATGSAYRPIAYFGASMAVVFLFFTMGSSARSLLAEHAEGTLTRVRASPVADRAVLLGRSLSALLLGVLSLVTVWLATTFAFGADWGDPLGVLVVIVAAVLAVAGIGSLITGLAGTVAQANAYTTLVAFVLALLGGSFQPVGSLPGILAQLSVVTPNGVTQRAFVLLGAGGAGVVDVLPLVACLVAIAAVTLTIGIRLIRGKVIA